MPYRSTAIAIQVHGYHRRMRIDAQESTHAAGRDGIELNGHLHARIVLSGWNHRMTAAGTEG